jgi:hypothetical protein
MRIELTSGHTVLADDADLELLLSYSWHLHRTPGCSRLYAQARLRGSGRPYKRIKMHRLLMSPPDGFVVHHINNNGLDNRRCNLQVTTQRVNIRHAYKSGTVHFQGGRWRAVARDEAGKRISLGMYETEDRARAVLQNWNYRKMLELEESSDQSVRDLAAVIANNLEARQS